MEFTSLNISQYLKARDFSYIKIWIAGWKMGEVGKPWAACPRGNIHLQVINSARFTGFALSSICTIPSSPSCFTQLGYLFNPVK